MCGTRGRIGCCAVSVLILCTAERGLACAPTFRVLLVNITPNIKKNLRGYNRAVLWRKENLGSLWHLP